MDYASLETRYRQRQQRTDEIRPGNQAQLMAVLAAAGVVEVIVTFDGCGDSGQIESIDARAEGGEVVLPDVGVEITLLADDSFETSRTVMPLREVIETLAYELLGRTHGGWEINEGAFDEFTFDVASGGIRLEYNERMLTSEFYEHAW